MSASIPVTTALPGQPQPARRMRRRWPWLLLGALVLALVLLAAGLAAALWLAVERTPRLPAVSTPVSGADLDRVRMLLERNDPRRVQPGVTRAAPLSQRDLELLLQQAGKRLAGGARGRVRLQPGLAVVDASLPLAATPVGDLLGGWLNLRAVLRETRGLPTVERLQLGRLPVPGWLAEAALPPLLRALNLHSQGELAQRLVRHVAFRSQLLVLAYAWPDNPQQAFAESFLPADDQARLRRHAEYLSGLLARLTREGSHPVSLNLVLQHMFAQAATHSIDAAGAALENRAALVALAFAAAGQPLAPLLGMPPPDRRWQRPPKLMLQGRPDWPLHLLISAALAAESGSPLADAIGLYKEVADARHGSGFSFGDLAADRAGARLGLVAQRNPLRLQAALAAGQPESALLPPVHDLPENMPEAEFRRRFGGVGAPAYQAVLRDIEARLDGLPLLAGGR